MTRQAAKQAHKARWREQPLRNRIFAYLLGFAALLLLLLWLFQTVYLDKFYRATKIREIISAASLVEHNIDNEEVLSLLDRVASGGEMCVRVYNLSVISSGRVDETPGYDADVLPDCRIHHLSLGELARLYNSALEAEGAYTETVRGGALRNGVVLNRDGGTAQFITRLPGAGQNESMVLSKVFYNAQGDELLLLLNSNILPVNATVNTLRLQLQFITGIMIIAALIISYLVARRLSAPIIRINAAAKHLATGDFSVTFDGKGYQETGELAATLNYAAAELSRTERLQQELVANISHDLRTPLTMISGYAEVMRDLPEENNAENAQVIIDEARRLSSLVNDVLDLSQLQAGIDQSAFAEFDLAELTEGIVERYRHLSAVDGYTINLESAGEAWVRADQKQIGQAIYNFLNNALTYTGEDKTVTVRLLTREGQARLEVADSGPGIEPARQNDIWQRYYRLEGAHKRAAHGTGLGLSIVRQVLERHGAAYGVESKVGVGSTFWFELPLL